MAARIIEQADHALAKGQFERALSHYEIANRLYPGDPRGVLGMARAEAELGRCADAVPHVESYLTRVGSPNAAALRVYAKCPRPKAPAEVASVPVPVAPPPPPTPPPTIPSPPLPAPSPAATSKRERPRRFLISLEAGVDLTLNADPAHQSFIGTLELGLALSNRLGLDVVLLCESIVGRGYFSSTSDTVSTFFTERLLLGLEERREITRRLSLFGTFAAGVSISSRSGFENGGVLHADAGLGIIAGPGEFRIRPVAVEMIIGDDFEASWRLTAGYAFRF